MAQTPPPFQPQSVPEAPATKSANKACLVIVICILTLCAVMIVIGIGFFKGVWGQVSNTMSCVAMFELSDAAIEAYAMENDGKYPNAETWQDDISPYYEKLYAKFRSEELPKSMMPPAVGQQLQCTWEGRTTGIAFNVELSGKEVAKIKDPTTTAVIFETEQTGSNLTMKFNPKPKAKAPKVMYNERDWIVYFVQGNKNPFESSSSRSTSFEIKPEDALPLKKPAKPKVEGK